MKLGYAVLVLGVVACSAGSDGSGGGASPPTSGGGGTDHTGGAAPSGGGGSTITGFGGGFEGGNGTGGGIICSPAGPDDDVDMDGFTPNQGDCEDCDPNRNPNAIEVPTEDGDTAYDENCDGEIDEEPPPPCDADIALDDLDPLSAARAVELCKMSSGVNDWGVVSAAWVMADGSPPPSDPSTLQRFHLGHGFLDHFGANVGVRAGDRMLELSSGTARNPDEPGYSDVGGFGKGYTSGFPVGFPKESPACPGSITGTPNDPTGVEIVVRTPSNATGFSFDFDFFTYEWPNFVCSTYNDFFIANLVPFPAGQTDGNISYDGDGNPISVNNALLEVCGCDGNPPNACSAGGKTFTCSLGDIQLIGTGFGFDTGFQDHGSTSWLRTTAPVEGNSDINLRFVVHDSGDGILDTSTLVDNLMWIATPGTTVGTNPVPQ